MSTTLTNTQAQAIAAAAIDLHVAESEHAEHERTGAWMAGRETRRARDAASIRLADLVEATLVTPTGGSK